VFANKTRTLPQIINDISQDQDRKYGLNLTDRKTMANNRSYYVNAKFRNVVATDTHVWTNAQNNRHLAPGEIQSLDEKLKYSMEADLKDQFILVEAMTKKGNYLNIKIKPNEHWWSDLQYQMYSRNKFYYVFFFTFVNDKEKLNRKHHWFAIRKTIAEVEAMGDNNDHALITMHDDVCVFNENSFDGKDEGDNLKQYTTMMKLQDLVEMQRFRPDRPDSQDYNINLTFEKCIDNKTQIDFVPIVYQLKYKNLQNKYAEDFERKKGLQPHMLVFDVQKMEVVRHTSILAKIQARRYTRRNEMGFNEYTLTRTSDVFNQKKGFFDQHKGHAGDLASSQIVKYQLSTQYYLPNELKCDPDEDELEFFLRQEPSKATIELVEYNIQFSCCH